jgi:hypothetical protein
MTIGEEERMYIIVPRSGSIYYRSRAGHVLDYVISQRDDSVIMWASTIFTSLCRTLDAASLSYLRTTTMSSLPESGTRTPPPPASAVQEPEPFTSEQFLDYLNVRGDLFPSDISNPPDGLSIGNFCSLANEIAKSIKARREHRLLCIYLFLTTHDFSLDFPNDNLLMFEDTERKIPKRHVTGTKCRPDITAAFEKHWTKDHKIDWGLIRLAGEKASLGKTFGIQKKNAATYLHYLLLARPDFLVAQGLLTTKSTIMFLVGIAGVGIRQLEVDWKDKDAYKYIYAFIYRLYDPSHFADPSYTRTEFNKETSEATYDVHFKMKKYPNFRAIHARNPFMTRTHVLSNPSLTPGDDTPTVLKEQLCRTGRRFDELTILTKIYQPTNVPGVVEAVGGEIIPGPLSSGREKHSLGLRQTGSPFTSIPTAKIMLETLFDLLEGI